MRFYAKNIDLFFHHAILLVYTFFVAETDLQERNAADNDGHDHCFRNTEGKIDFLETMVIDQ